jgi:hypothetical protein
VAPMDVLADAAAILYPARMQMALSLRIPVRARGRRTSPTGSGPALSGRRC